MKLSQKIKHIKRHRANKRFVKLADSFHSAAAECFINDDEIMFIVSSRLYNVMNRRKGCVPKNIKQSPLNCDRQIITVSRDIIEFYNDNPLNYLKEWCGIPKGADIPFVPGSERESYMHIDKSIAPAITTFDGVRV